MLQGVGKTTLTKELSVLYNLPKYHIDGIHHLDNWKKRDKQERDKILSDIIKTDKWIIDGTYKSTLVDRFKIADLVIWLDYSTFAQLKGIFKRLLTTYGKEKEEIPGCKERLNFTFVKYVFMYNKRKRIYIIDCINKCKPKELKIFKNRKLLNKWLILEKEHLSK